MTNSLPSNSATAVHAAAPKDEQTPSEGASMNQNVLEIPMDEPPAPTTAPVTPQHNPAVIDDVMTMPTDEVSNDPKQDEGPMEMPDEWSSREPAQVTNNDDPENDSANKKQQEQLNTDDSDNAFFGDKQQEQNAEESESFSPDDPEIQQDAAERYVACIVHVMLFFFIALAVISAILALILVSQYGFFAVVVISLLMIIVVGIVMFVDKAMKDQAEWKPVRRKIQRWKALATAVVLKEIRDFQLDWNEHLLLTDGSDYNLYEEDDEVPAMDVDTAAAAAAKDAKPKKKRGGRSAIFKVVKPFLKVGGRRRRKRKEKEAAAASAQGDPADGYIPPVV